MDGQGYSIWIILMLIMLLFVIFWGALVFFLGFGAWLIGRLGPPDDDLRPRRRDDEYYAEPKDGTPRPDR